MQLKIDTIEDSSLVRVWRYKGFNSRLVICFSGIGSMNEDIPPSYDFASSATEKGGNNVLYIADPNRSWLNAPGLIERIIEHIDTVRREQKIDAIYTLGHSMGGFSALALPKYYPIDVSVAFSPQFSVHTDVCGDDPRWMLFRERIKQFRLISLNECFVGRTHYFVFHGRHHRETPQRERFPQAENLDHYVIPNTHHNVPQRLKKAAILENIITYSFRKRRRRVRQQMATLGARKKNRSPLAPSSKLKGSVANFF